MAAIAVSNASRPLPPLGNGFVILGEMVGIYEVLTRAANGHRTVHRLAADSVEAARAAVEAELDPGSVVQDAAPAGTGLGSGDNE